MTPNQRAAAERLAHQLNFLTQPFAHEAADLLRKLAAEQQRDPDWTLLLVGPENGLVGKYGHNFPGSPEHYERVHVVRVDGIGRAA